MERVAVFAGSFDPFTAGHEEIVRRGLKMFDRIIVAVGVNAVKKGFLDVDTRLAIVRKVFAGEERVSVTGTVWRPGFTPGVHTLGSSDGGTLEARWHSEWA